jgi:hypothetical protein
MTAYSTRCSRTVMSGHRMSNWHKEQQHSALQVSKIRQGRRVVNCKTLCHTHGGLCHSDCVIFTLAEDAQQTT